MALTITTHGSKKRVARNPLFYLKKFRSFKRMEDVHAAIKKNWYEYGYCVICHKKAPKLLFDHLVQRGGWNCTVHTCSPSCRGMYNLSHYGCCDKAVSEPTFAYDHIIKCPIHGEQRFGTSD
jgi:hypothetical protein